MIVTDNFWTSDLYVHIKSENVSRKEIINAIHSTRIEVEDSFSVDRMECYKHSLLDEPYRLSLGDEDLTTASIFKRHGYTSVMKGIFIDLLAEKFSGRNLIINFGGDIKVNNCRTRVAVNEFLSVEISSGTVCTSGNNGKRGNHIEALHRMKSCTNIMKSSSSCLNDFITTQLFADPSVNVSRDDLLPIYTRKDGTFSIGFVYIASPFFNKKEIAIRDRMLSKLELKVRPDETELSKQYDTVKHTREMARKIMEENISMIKQCNALCFPEGTTDLGTLFEVGFALQNHIPVIRYNDTTGVYTLVDYNSLYLPQYENGTIIECTNATAGVLLGFNYGVNLRYDLKSFNDNIMLAMNFTQVKLNSSDDKNVDYIEVESNMETVQ